MSTFDAVQLVAVALARGLVLSSSDLGGLVYTAGPLRQDAGPVTWVMLAWRRGGETVVEGDSYKVAVGYVQAVGPEEACGAARRALEPWGSAGAPDAG